MKLRLFDTVAALGFVRILVLNQRSPEAAHTVMALVAGPFLCWMAYTLIQRAKH